MDKLEDFFDDKEKAYYFNDYGLNLKLKDCRIFPGSFNPIHDGHLEIIAKAQDYNNKVSLIGSVTSVVVELSIFNVDKPEINKSDIYDRINNFRRYGIPYVISKCPTFVSKSVISNKFVVGQDTFNRILDPKYCNLEYLKCKLKQFDILVFGRNGQEFNLDNVELFKSCKFIEYNNDISSSRIRDENR